ncbi:MAG: hypothetical protein ACE5IY_21440 [bacterium]
MAQAGLRHALDGVDGVGIQLCRLADEQQVKAQGRAGVVEGAGVKGFEDVGPGRGAHTLQETGGRIVDKSFKQAGVDALTLEQTTVTGLAGAHDADGAAQRVAKGAAQQRTFERRQIARAFRRQFEMQLETGEFG